MRNLLLWFFLLTVSAALAQTDTATVFGTARDSTGGVVPGLAVTMTNELTGQTRSTMSGATGDYGFPLLPVGRYTLAAEKAGFKKFVRKGITLEVNQNARVDIDLEVGALAETVTVEANANQVDTLTGALRETVDAERMVQLPLNGRNPFQLQFLTPGTIGTNLTSGRSQNEGISINGARPDANNYILDGGDYNDPYFNLAPALPSPDALQEFTVLANSYSAEYGRNAGGVINAVTRSGTNQLHGALYEFLRNQVLDARPFFSAARTPFRQNQFGGTLGGPIDLPRLYKGKDRTFFFMAYEGLRVRSSAGSSTTPVPTPAERTGDFSQSGAIRDPLGGTFAGNIIPPSRLDPTAQNFLAHFVPLPNVGQRLLSFVNQSRTDGDQATGKVDHNFSDKNHLSGRYIFLNVDSKNSSGTLPGFFTNPTQRNHNLQVRDTYILSPSLLNTASFSFGRINQSQYPEAPGNLSWADLGAKIPTAKLQPGPNAYLTQVAGYFTADTGNQTIIARDYYQVADNVSYSRGKQMLTAGVEFRDLSITGGGDYYSDPVIVFQGNFSGNSLADFLLGRPTQYQQISPVLGTPRQETYSLYIQDDWRISHNFTLNLGLRYDPYYPLVDANNQFSSFRAGLQSQLFPTAPNGTLFAGDPGIPRSIIPPDLNNFAPRFGFAADPTGTGKISIRGGYGIFYDTPQIESYSSFATNQPFALQLVITAPPSLSDPFAGRTNPFPFRPPSTPQARQSYNFVTPMVMGSLAPGFLTPYVQQWNLNVQNQVHKNWLVTLAYVGSKGTKLFSYTEANPAIYIPGKSTTGNTDQRRPYAPYYGSIKQEGTFADSTYHAMELSLNKRVSRGFSILTSYTFGKLLDLTSKGTFYGSDQPTNPFNLRADKGPADFDVSHRWVTSFVWDLPGFGKQHHALRYAFSGWEINGIWSYQSGMPFSIMSGRDNSFSGVGRDRADLVGVPYLPTDRPRSELIQQFFNTKAFAPNALGTFGNSGRNILRGLGGSNADLALVKRVPLREHAHLDLRAEFFNAFNQVHLNQPVANLSGGANFGRITGAGVPRVIQLALKLNF